MTTRLILIRHAPTLPDYSRPAAEWELDPAGLPALDRLAGHPELAAVERFFTSPEPKARQTAERLAAGRPIEEMPELAELRRPAGYVKEYAQMVTRAMLEPDRPVLPGWESAADCRQRVLAAMATIAISYPDRTVAVVSHGIALALFLAWLRGRQQADPAEWQSMRMPDLAVATWKPRKVIVPFGR